MQRRNKQSWYMLTNLTDNTQRPVPMNRAARRYLRKLTGDVGLMPPILHPLTKEQRLAKIKAREEALAKQATEQNADTSEKKTV